MTSTGAGQPSIPLGDLLVQPWGLEDGLPTVSLTDVRQTRDGFLWVASYEGLFRFDGLGFENFDRHRLSQLQSAGPELVSDNFTDLVEDRFGTLWIAGQAGQILRHNDGDFTVIPSAIEGPVRALCVDVQDRLWVGGLPVQLIDVETSQPLPLDVAELRGMSIESVHCTHESIWLGAGDGTLFELDSALALRRRLSVGSHAIEALVPTSDGALWIGSRDGAQRIHPHSTLPEHPLQDVGVHDLLEDSRGDLWLATTRGLARQRASRALEWLDVSRAFPAEIQGLTFDHEGNLWLATKGQGLLRLVEAKVRGITERQGLRSGTVDALLETQDGRVLVGFDQYLAGVSSTDAGTTVQPLELPNDLGDFDVLALEQGDAGNLWVGSYLGLLSLSTDGGSTWWTEETGFPSSEIRALHRDPRGTLWIGTGDRGVLAVDPADPAGSVEILDSDTGLVSDFVFAIDGDIRGNLYFAMRGGFHIRTPDGGLITHRSGVDIPGSLVFSVLPEEDGTLWLGTDRGLTRMAPEGHPQTLGKAHGLPTDAVFDVRSDAQGQLWMSSSVGILRLDRETAQASLDASSNGELLPLENLTVLDHTDGMSHRQCTGARRILQARDGRLWFPTHDGVTLVDPSRFALNDHIPPVAIHRWQVDGVEVPRQGLVELPAGLGRLTFEVAVLSLRQPSANRVRYRLEGFDTAWHDAGPERQISYTSLPHGRYTFRVEGSNDDGVWNPAEARLSFEVLPFYYQTPFFWSLIALGTLLAVSAVYHWRHRALWRSHRSLQASSEQRYELLMALRQRTQEIDNYLYIFSHDLKNPLLTINNFAERVRRDIAANALDRAQDDLGRIVEAAQRMNKQLDDLLAVAAVERSTGETTLFSLTTVLHEALAHYAAEIEAQGIDLVAPSPGSFTAWVTGDRYRILQALQELVANALKFLGDAEPPRIEVGLQGDGSQVLGWVRDNGIGIDDAYLERVFRPLEQLDPRHEGTGIGLAFVSRVIETHGGRVWLDSEGVGRGTTVRFTLPAQSRRPSTA